MTGVGNTPATINGASSLLVAATGGTIETLTQVGSNSSAQGYQLK